MKPPKDKFYTQKRSRARMKLWESKFLGRLKKKSPLKRVGKKLKGSIRKAQDRV